LSGSSAQRPGISPSASLHLQLELQNQGRDAKENFFKRGQEDAGGVARAAETPSPSRDIHFCRDSALLSMAGKIKPVAMCLQDLSHRPLIFSQVLRQLLR